LKLGERIQMGQNIGILGKEGSAGCWSHLHYEIRSPQPSGKTGIQEGYAFLWEAYQKQYAPELIAVARPHSFVWMGEPVALDGTGSWSRAGPISRYEWTLSNRTTAQGPITWTTYQRPGTYSEILKVTDSRGRTAYDFAVVQVVSRQTAGKSDDESLPPTIHAAYGPTMNLRPGEPITFQVRTCRTTEGHEQWNFGDGTPPVTVTSDGCAQEKNPEGYAKTQHKFTKPGDYLVTVERANARGEKATARLHVRIPEQR
jgi:murein DD-endopeptidase MepM/ murein hydrolase activator NlpD